MYARMYAPFAAPMWPMYARMHAPFAAPMWPMHARIHAPLMLPYMAIYARIYAPLLLPYGLCISLLLLQNMAYSCLHIAYCSKYVWAITALVQIRYKAWRFNRFSNYPNLCTT